MFFMTAKKKTDMAMEELGQETLGQQVTRLRKEKVLPR